MPMTEDGPTFRIADSLEQVRLWEIVEAGVTLMVECVSCHRRTSWPPDLIRRRLKSNLANRLVQVAGRFRCAACRSRYVRICRESQAASANLGEPRPDPARKRGFGPENLDANARGGGGLRARR